MQFQSQEFHSCTPRIGEMENMDCQACEYVDGADENCLDLVGTRNHLYGFRTTSCIITRKGWNKFCIYLHSKGRHYNSECTESSKTTVNFNVILAKVECGNSAHGLMCLCRLSAK